MQSITVIALIAVIVCISSVSAARDNSTTVTATVFLNTTNGGFYFKLGVIDGFFNTTTTIEFSHLNQSFFPSASNRYFERHRLGYFVGGD
jgi:hypothetical protein